MESAFCMAQSDSAECKNLCGRKTGEIGCLNRDSGFRQKPE